MRSDLLSTTHTETNRLIVQIRQRHLVSIPLCGELEDEVIDLIRQEDDNIQSIVIDFSKVDILCTLMMHVIIYWQKEAMTKGKLLHLSGIRNTSWPVIVHTGLDKILVNDEEVEE